MPHSHDWQTNMWHLRRQVFPPKLQLITRDILYFDHISGVTLYILPKMDVDSVDKEGNPLDSIASGESADKTGKEDVL